VTVNVTAFFSFLYAELAEYKNIAYFIDLYSIQTHANTEELSEKEGPMGRTDLCLIIHFHHPLQVPFIQQTI
jgi:hypothetical protein